MGGAKRRGVRVIPHATRLRTQLTWRNLALVAGFCLVLCLSPVVGSGRRKGGSGHGKSGKGRHRCKGSLYSKTITVIKESTSLLTAAGITLAGVTAMIKAFGVLAANYCGEKGCTGFGRRRLPVMECPLKEPPNITNVRRRLPVMERLLKEIEAARAKEY